MHLLDKRSTRALGNPRVLRIESELSGFIGPWSDFRLDSYFGGTVGSEWIKSENTRGDVFNMEFEVI
ncbi:hypothetical protein AALP_AA8G293600 [Arabis alpina]|uniref:Uncharacterized protein n=1 Tax=Arabis alpina TaxID=50452 RepID=A0A087GA86_ARAAL|nr:hypothetical protein AALP_AA8G293600 [Arabis alpina]